jgi:hypothetical protein
MIEEKKKSSQKGNNPLSLKKWIFHNKKHVMMTTVEFVLP